MALRDQQLKVLLTLEKKGFDQGVQETKRGLGDLGKDVAKMGIAFAAAAAGVAAAGKQLYDLGKRGAIVTQTADSFDFLSKKLGLAPNLLEQLRAASRGTIDDMTLMSSTATLLAGTTDELGKRMGDATPQLLEIAKAANKLNPSLGTTAYMYESIATGIKRSSPLILDNLGLTIKIGAANEAMAQKLGKSVESLTAEEKQMALLNATLEAGDLLIAQVGGTTASAADEFAKFETRIANLKDRFAKELSPSVSDSVVHLLNLGDAVTDFMAVENMLNMALDQGIITQEEYNQKMREHMLFSLDLGEAKQFLFDKEAQLAVGLENTIVYSDMMEERFQHLHNITPIVTTDTENLDLATQNLGSAFSYTRSTTDILSTSMQTYSDKLLFNKAAALLDSEAALDLAEKMGLVDTKSRYAAAAMDYLTQKYDTNRDGAIDASEQTDAYSLAVLRLKASIDALRDKTVTIRTIFIEQRGPTRQTGPTFEEQTNTTTTTQQTWTPPTTSTPQRRQHGGSFIVPPGFPNDSFPVWAESGEQVIVLTKEQQRKKMGFQGGMGGAGRNWAPYIYSNIVGATGRKGDFLDDMEDTFEDSSNYFAESTEKAGKRWIDNAQSSANDWTKRTTDASNYFGESHEKSADQWQRSTENASSIWNFHVADSGDEFYTRTVYASNDFQNDINWAGSDFYRQTGMAGDAFTSAGITFGRIITDAGGHFARTVMSAGSYLASILRSAGAYTASTPSPTPYTPPTTYPPTGGGPAGPEAPYYPPTGGGAGGGGTVYPPTGGGTTGGKTTTYPPTGSGPTYNTLVINTNAPVDSDISDLLLLRAWSSG